jgi:protein-S-isoprenylcysteine O-methyltransferase
VTAVYNTPAADVDAFLLTSNGPAYIGAHTLAAVECLLTKLTVGNSSVLPFPIPSVFLALGLFLVIFGQGVRTTAMIQAGTSFNHTVQSWRKDDHALVTTGVYGWLRHPSYFGFFWWALGTQLVLGNRLMFVAYAIVIWRFFRQRISYEERTLVFFFGRDYTAYRERVGTWIPLIK